MRADELLHPRRCVAFGRLAAGVRDRALLPHYLAAVRIPDKFIRANVGPLIPQVTVVSDHPLHLRPDAVEGRRPARPRRRAC